MGANGITGSEAGKALGDAITVNTVLKELDLSGGEDYWMECDAEFVKGFSPGLGANGALVKFDISNNDIMRDGAQALAEALKDNQVMKELNIARNPLYYPDMSGVFAISNAIPTMGALETITFGDKQAATMKADMTKANLSGKQLDAAGAIIVGAFLPKCQ